MQPHTSFNKCAQTHTDMHACTHAGGIIDGGECPCSVGIESTIVDCSIPGRLSILRPGGITKEDIERCTGIAVISVGVDGQSAEEGPKAPA